MKKLLQLIKRTIIFTFACCLIKNVYANNNIVNVYTWAEEIPYFVIQQFEKETGIKVNYSTFDTNEIMLAKIRASQHPTYDLIEPSSFFIDRLRHMGMLEKLDKSRLPNFIHLDPLFLNATYDPQNNYSIPFVWGVTGIFLNKNYFKAHDADHLGNLFDHKFSNQLMFLDNSREVFSMALRMLGYSINDTNPAHIKEAYLKLKALMPNVRLFNSDAVTSILIDEDATIGMAWNGDVYKAHRENSQLQFVYPKDGFEIWVDNFAILKGAQHVDNAYRFLNFLMRPDIAKAVSLKINYSTANLTARKLMPLEVRNNVFMYPDSETLRRGEFQLDVNDTILNLIEHYWEQLKMGG